MQPFPSIKSGPMISPLQYVSISVGKRVFSKTTHSIFLKLLMKLWCLKGKKLTQPDFSGKFHFGDNAQKHPKNIWV